MTHTPAREMAQADRVRESEAYDLERVQQARLVAVDCPTSRVLAIGAAALGAEVLLASRPGAPAPHDGFLLPGGSDAPHPAAGAFISETLLHWFPDARAAAISIASESLADLLDAAGRSDGGPQLLVLPAEPWAMVAVCDLLSDEALHNRDDIALRLVAAGAGGCCIVSPQAEEYEAQVEGLLDMMDRNVPGHAHADAAMIAAGTLLHEMRLLAGATMGDDTEAFPMSRVCRLRLPAPVDGAPGRRRWACVGAGGIGSALALLGVAATAGEGDSLLLADGDRVEPHNLLLHRHAGAPKVNAVRDELRRMLVPIEVDLLPRMVDETTVLPGEYDLLFAVTDSAGSRLVAQEAFFEGGRAGLMVSAGSTLTGAEAFYVGGPARAACIRCRLPLAEMEAAAGADCSRRPACFASNLVAAGLALALARRRDIHEFSASLEGLSRFGVTTARPERFGACLPQRCEHWEASPGGATAR